MARLIPPLLGPRTVVVPFQNGVEAPALLAEAVPARQVAGGVAYISASIVQPGHIRHVGKFASLRVGALDPSQADALARLGEAGRRAADVVGHVDRDARALWEKFVFLVALSGLTAVSRQPIGVVRADPDLRAALVAAMRETVAVAHAHGVTLSEDLVDTHLATVDRLPADVKASMAHDLDKGKPLEAPWLSGGVARLGAAAGVDTPVNRTLYAALKPYLNGRQ